MNIYTIGFTKKSAQEFFEIIKKNKIKIIIDVRLNNSSQLSGFSKGRDLKYFLKEILDVDYIHNVDFSPTKEILNDYKKKNIDWNIYEEKFIKLLKERKLEKYIKDRMVHKLDQICFLCSEEKAEYCHRRLVAEYIKEVVGDKKIKIKHI